MDMNAIAEEYIEGQELYVSLIGNKRLEAFPIREMQFQRMSTGMPRFATYKAKWDEAYRQKWGIRNDFATGRAETLSGKIIRKCKLAYRALNLDGYARFDCRLTEDGTLYVVEANGNPELAQGDEFAESARKAGMTYDRLLHRILRLAFARE
jgi:D-alanine-D-alanine ligase